MENEMKREIIITRKSRNLGWNYATWTPEYPDKPTAPCYTGTAKTVLDAIASDRTFASLRDTYHTTQWFVKLNGSWHPAKFIFEDPSDLYITGPVGPYGETDYMADSITATIEINDAAAALGKLGGSKTSPLKAQSSSANGRKGGRPRRTE